MNCFKRRFDNRIEALIALSRSEFYAKKHHRQGSKSNQREEVRVYHCPMCKAWHLTSQRGDDERR